MISVIMPVYNRSEMMKEAIESYLSQKAESELIVIDDGSKEDIKSMIKSYHNNRIKFYRSEKNNGQACALNIGMNIASGDIICQLHTDDRLAPDILEKRILWHEQTRAEVIYTDNAKMFIDGIACSIDKPMNSAPINIIKKEHINFTTLSWKRSIIERVGYFDESYKAYFDWDWKIRLSMECSVAYIPEVSVFYRVHSGQLSVECRQDGTNEKEYKIMREKMKDKYGDLF